MNKPRDKGPVGVFFYASPRQFMPMIMLEIVHIVQNATRIR
jgi:hypothetical protein